jgi:hypothetical protein
VGQLLSVKVRGGIDDPLRTDRRISDQMPAGRAASYGCSAGRID